MAAYDVRVQVAMAGGIFAPTVSDLQRDLAGFLTDLYPEAVVTIDGQEWDPVYNSFDAEEAV